MNRMRKRWIRKAHSIGRHLLRKHDWRISVAGALSGDWLWHASCRCGLKHRGAESTEDGAELAAHEYVGRRDDHWHGDVFGTHGPHLWPRTPVLHVPAQQLVLPETVRGNGSVVACDGSRRVSDGHAGWAAITNTGWWMAGKLNADTENVRGLELLAIAHALRFYPDRHQVDVLSDNQDAIGLARRILSGRARMFVDCPGWAPHEAFLLLRKAYARQVNARVLYVRSKETPLHRVADRLARALPHEYLLTVLAQPTNAGGDS